jgi:hypothetical protein
MGRPGGRWRTSGPGWRPQPSAWQSTPISNHSQISSARCLAIPHIERPHPTIKHPTRYWYPPPLPPATNPPPHPTASWCAGLRRGSRSSAGPAACRLQRWPAQSCCPQSRGRSGWGLRKGIGAKGEMGRRGQQGWRGKDAAAANASKHAACCSETHSASPAAHTFPLAASQAHTIVQWWQADVAKVGRGGAGAEHQRRAGRQAQQRGHGLVMRLLAALHGCCRVMGCRGGRVRASGMRARNVRRHV